MPQTLVMPQPREGQLVGRGVGTLLEFTDTLCWDYDHCKCDLIVTDH